MIFKRKPKTAEPKSFDREARDKLKREPKLILERDVRCMLVKDNTGAYVAIDPSNMRLVKSARMGQLGPIIKHGPRVTLPLKRVS